MAGTDFLFSLAYIFVPRGPGGDFRGLGVPWGGGRGPWDPKITISAVGAYLTSNGFGWQRKKRPPRLQLNCRDKKKETSLDKKCSKGMG